jgi:tripartite-type tricarboxylate transporter receptor subunit TctC
LPNAILEKTDAAARGAMADASLTKRLVEQGADLAVDPSATSYSSFVANEAKRWEVIVKAAGIQPE